MTTGASVSATPYGLQVDVAFSAKPKLLEVIDITDAMPLAEGWSATADAAATSNRT
jgi:hypothetical protein